MLACEPDLVPSDLRHAAIARELPHRARHPSEARRVALLAVVEQHLEPDADAEERHAVVADTRRQRVGEPLLLERGQRGPRGADAGQDQAFRPADRLRRADEAARQTEVLERVHHTRRVPRPVVDHVDHARPSVVNRLNWTRRCSDDSRDAVPPPHCPSSRRAARAGRLSAVGRRAGLAGRAGAGHVAPRRRSSSSRTTGRTRPRASRTASQGASLEQLAQMFVDEGNRYLVRGDVAFAQSIVETGWFNFPDYGIVKPGEQQLRGHRRVRLVRQRLPVQQRAERRPGADPAPPELRRRQLAHDHDSRSSGTRALGQQPGDRGVQLRPLLREGARAALEQHGERQLGQRAELRAGRAARLQRHAHLQRATGPVPARCLALRPAHRGRAVSGGAAPTGPRDRGDAVRRLLRVERRRQRERVQRRTRARPSRPSTGISRATSR